MGTRSKMGWNERCQHRGPSSQDTLVEALEAVHYPPAHNRGARRRAASIIRSQGRFIEKNVPAERRSEVQQEVVDEALKQKLLGT